MGCFSSKADAVDDIDEEAHQSLIEFSEQKNVTTAYQSLTKFSEQKGLYLDESRKLFFERNDDTIKKLVGSQLVNKNRFRELLLGVKAVGKSVILTTIQEYVYYLASSSCQKIIALYICYDGAATQLLSTAICQNIYKKFGIKINLESGTSIYDRISDLDSALKAHQIFVVLLVDEFHFVYTAVESVGKPVISELFHIAGSNQGRIHCIVSGSSTILRRLAFVKYHGPKEFYPSYGSTDLNSTKLQPYWIFPMQNAKDFKGYCSKVGMPTDENIAHRYLYSVGRPGLVKKNITLTDLPYSVTGKGVPFNESTIEYKVLENILKCAHFISETTSDQISIQESGDNNLDSLCALLPHVLESTVRKDLPLPPDTNFEEVLYNLADDGFITIMTNYTDRILSISNIALFLEMNSRRSAMNLTLKELAALKMPTGLFSNLAEEAVLKILRYDKNFEHLFGISLELDRGSSSLDVGSSKQTSSGAAEYCISDAVHQTIIFNRLHKELNHGKDKNGADGIVLSGSMTKCTVVRLQVKLWRKIDVTQIRDIETDMRKRGQEVLRNLRINGFQCVEYKNYLLVPCYVKNYEANMREVEGEALNPSFEVVWSKQLSKIWPQEVINLGQPYSANSNLHKNY